MNSHQRSTVATDFDAEKAGFAPAFWSYGPWSSARSQYRPSRTVYSMPCRPTMRLVEVRDLIAGQGWFDLTQHRLDPPGVSMHWSRVIDAPLAASDAGALTSVRFSDCFPGCLALPYADVDPILATFWLDSVAEATSLQSMLQLVPQKIPGFYGFPMLTLGLAGAAPIAPPRRPDFDHAIIAAPLSPQQ